MTKGDKQAANPVGAPRKLDCGQRKNIYMDQPSIDEAIRQGGGDLSKGVRRALGFSAKRPIQADVPADVARKLERGQRKNIYMDQPSIEEAMRQGGGDLSKGVRRALEAAAKDPEHRASMDAGRMQRKDVYLDQFSIEEALRLGHGDLSQGVRQALTESASRTKNG